MTFDNSKLRKKRATKLIAGDVVLVNSTYAAINDFLWCATTRDKKLKSDFLFFAVVIENDVKSKVKTGMVLTDKGWVDYFTNETTWIL